MNRFSSGDIVRPKDGAKLYVIHELANAFTYRDKNIEYKIITYNLIPKNVHERFVKEPMLDITPFILSNVNEDNLILIQ